MFRHVTTDRADLVADAVGCIRVFATVFVGTGLFALNFALFGGGGLDEAGLGARLALGVIGAMHLGGALAIWLAPHTRALVQRRGVDWSERRVLRPARTRYIPPSEVDQVTVEEKADSDGDAVYRVTLALRSGEWVPLTGDSTPTRDYAEAVAAAVARRLQIPDRLG